MLVVPFIVNMFLPRNADGDILSNRRKAICEWCSSYPNCIYSVLSNCDKNNIIKLMNFQCKIS